MNKEVVALTDVGDDMNFTPSEVISDLDDMYQGNMEHYQSVGRSALRCIRLALELSGKRAASIKSILDFPCGFGRVLRMMSAAYPDAKITGCDLVREGVDFCAEQFGSRAVYSDKDLSNVELGDSYDLIWVGSLLTHVDEAAWRDFISFFSAALKPGGLLLFTTQGRYPVSLLTSRQSTYGLESDEKIENLLTAYSDNGFGFSSYFHSDDYGITLSSPSRVMDHLLAHDDLKIVMSLEQGWDNHQDVFAVMKVGS